MDGMINIARAVLAAFRLLNHVSSAYKEVVFTFAKVKVTQTCEQVGWHWLGLDVDQWLRRPEFAEIP